MIDNIKEVIEEKGLNYEAASTQSGLDRSYFRKLFDRGGRSPRGETLMKIANGLEVPVSRLLEGATETTESRPVTKDVRPASAPVPNHFDLPMDIPVRGTAAGSHLRGAFQLSADPIDYVRRPPALIGARDIYSLYVEGESMVPQFWPGDLIYVNSHKPPRFGDAVVIQCQLSHDGEVEATIGIFFKRSTDKIVIQKHNPRAEIEISRSTVVSIHKILTLNELFGV